MIQVNRPEDWKENDRLELNPNQEVKLNDPILMPLGHTTEVFQNFIATHGYGIMVAACEVGTGSFFFPAVSKKQISDMFMTLLLITSETLIEHTDFATKEVLDMLRSVSTRISLSGGKHIGVPLEFHAYDDKKEDDDQEEAEDFPKEV